jgi:hypothetical protein
MPRSRMDACLQADDNSMLHLTTYVQFKVDNSCIINLLHKSVKIHSSVTLVAFNVLFCLRRLERNSFIATYNMASNLTKNLCGRMA